MASNVLHGRRAPQLEATRAKFGDVMPFIRRPQRRRLSRRCSDALSGWRHSLRGLDGYARFRSIADRAVAKAVREWITAVGAKTAFIEASRRAPQRRDLLQPCRGQSRHRKLAKALQHSANPDDWMIVPARLSALWGDSGHRQTRPSEPRSGLPAEPARRRPRVRRRGHAERHSHDGRRHGAGCGTRTRGHQPEDQGRAASPPRPVASSSATLALRRRPSMP